MKLSDFAGVFKTNELRVLKTWREDDEFVVELESRGITWKPGVHGIFSMPNNKVRGKKWRAFSIASTPEEEVIRIATKLREPLSSYKSELIKLKKGDTIKMRGPFGWFYRKDRTSPVVMIAGGVGITPIMAMVEQYQQDPTESDVNVIYSSSGSYLFKDKLSKAAKSNPKISLCYVSGEQVEHELNSLVKKHGNDAYYYVSGAPSMVKDISKSIKRSGIKRSRIISDAYFGY